MTCFLCLSELPAFVFRNNEDKEEIERVNCVKVSLAAINNYLKLSEKCSSSNFSDDGKGTEVLLCLECEPVASRLSKLCVQLEEIKLKLNYSLEQFYGRLEEADEGMDDNLLEEQLFLMRRHYRNKCKTRLNHEMRQPVIQLEKLKGPKMELELPDEQESFGDDFDLMTEGSEQEHEQLQNITVIVKEDISQFEDEWEDNTSSLSFTPSSSSHHSTTNNVISQDGSVNCKFTCPTCGLEFPTMWERRQHMQLHRNARKFTQAKFICTNCDNHQMFKEATGLRNHNMLFHPELLFPHFRIEGITADQFREYCKHVLHVEGLVSKKPNSLGYECQHCHLEHQNLYLSTYLCLKKHLFRNHMDVLAQKIEELQKTTGPEELKQVALPPVRDNRKCEDCGATFSQSDSLSRHLKQSCPFRKNKSVSAARPCECQECGARYSGTAAFYRHRKSKHPNSIKVPLFISSRQK